MFCTLSVLRNSPLNWAWIAAPMAHHALLATVGLEYCVEGPGIICRPCGFVVATSKLHEHLRDRHNLKLALRRTAVEHAYSLNVEHDLSRLVPRADGSDIISSLSLHAGFLCLQYRLKTTSEITMTRHLSQFHRLPGACPSYDDSYEAVKLQTWLPNKRTKYWQVVEPPPPQMQSTAARSYSLEGF
jgi:hypothetical protein